MAGVTLAMKRFLISLLLFLPLTSVAADSLSYSGRLVNANGSPVAGPVNLQFDLSYTDAPAVVVCTKDITGVALTNGVFHVKLEFLAADCGGDTLAKVLTDTPAGETVAIKVTDETNGKAYSAQALHAMPYALVSESAKTLVQMGATANQVLKWNGTAWAPANESGGGGGGSVTNIATGTGLTGGPITATGTISIANLGVDTAQLAASAVTDAKVSATAAIARSKLASGTADHVVINDSSGVLSSAAQLPVALGGTGAGSAAGARTALGLGTAAVANIGTSAGNVMSASGVPSCLAGEKLQMGAGPVYAWSCVADVSTDGSKLPLAGGTMSGAINMDGNAIDMDGGSIDNLAAPTADGDAATKKYVDDTLSASTLWTLNSGDVGRASGKVGVGTTSPATALHIAAAPGTFATQALSFGDGDTGIYETSDDRLRITLNSVDGVDIGQNYVSSVTSRGYYLKKAAGDADAPSFTFVSDTDTGIYSNAADMLRFATGGTHRVTIDSVGRMGIGTDTPSAILDIVSTTSGILIPRVTTAERDAIAAPVAGMQVYNTSTNKLNYHNGTSWQEISAASGAGTVTSIVAGPGLTGGTITTSGTIAVDVGTTASKIVQLDGSAKLPAVDGSALTSLTPANLASAVPVNKGGTGLTALGAADTVLGVNGAGTAAEYKAITAGTGVSVTHGAGTITVATTGAPPTGTAGGDLDGTYPNPTVDAIQGTAVSGAASASGQILIYDGTDYSPTVLSGDATMSGAGAVTLATVGVGKGGTGATSFTGNRLIASNALGTALESISCSTGEILTFNVSGDYVCSSISSATGAFVNGGNSFGAAATLGTNDGNKLNFETNNTVAMTIDANGRIGIGETSPTTQLHLKHASGPTIRLERTGDAAISQIASSGGNLTFRADPGNAATLSRYSFELDGTEVFRIDTGGEVGIGTTAPNAPLHVEKDNANAKINVKATGTGQYSILNLGNETDEARGQIRYDNDLDQLELTSGGTGQRIVVKATGQVGVGATSPSAKLHVSSGSSGATPHAFGARGTVLEDDLDIALQFLTPNTETGSILFGDPESNTVGMLRYAHATDTFSVRTAGTDNRLVIDGNGKVGIGTSSPSGILDISSTTSGVVMPRMTTVQRDAIAAPVAGMQVYNTTTNQLNFHNGSSWQALGTAGAGISSLTAGTGLTGGTITTSGTIAVDVGTTASKIVQLDGSAKLPAVDGSALTNLNPANLSAAVPVAKGGTGLTALGAANTVLGVNNAGTAAEYKAISGTSPVTATHGAGTITLALSTVPVASGGTGATSFTGNRLIASNALGTALQGVSCSTNEVLTFDVSGDYVCSTVASLMTTGFVNGGNTFGANASLGTNDANHLFLETNNTTRVTIRSNGDVGIGTTAPDSKLDIVGAAGPGTIRLKNVATDAADKAASIAAGHYTNAEEPVTMLFSNVSSTSNSVWMGGGNSSQNAATVLQFFTAANNTTTTGTERMRIASDGKVGIGTTSPTNLLHIYKTGTGSSGVSLSSDAGSSLALFANQSAGGHNALTQANDAVVTYNAGVVDSGGLVVGPWSASAKGLRMNSSGNVGIHRASPSYPLDVNGDARMNAVFTNPGAPGASIVPHYILQNGSGRFKIGLVGTETGSGNAGSDFTISSYDDGAGYMATPLFIRRSSGNVGIGMNSPTAYLHLKAGTATANTAPLKFNAGTVLTTPENGAMEFDGTDFFLTAGGVRRTIASTGGSSNYSSSGTITTTNATASTSPSTGALVVSGGVGVGGALNVGTSTTTPTVYGSSAASGDLVLESTSNGTKGDVLVNPSGGSVGIGTASPSVRLDVKGASGSPATSGTAQTGAFRLQSSGANSNVLDMGTQDASPFGAWLQVTSRSNLANTYPLVLNPNGGNVGVGVASPTYKLHVGGNIGVSGGTIANPVPGDDALLILAGDSTASTSTANISLWGKSNASWPGDVHITSRGAGGVKFFDYNGTGWDQNMVITSAGLVGIGQTAPAHPLDVRSAGAAQMRLTGTDAAQYTQLLLNGTGKLFQVGVGNASETSFGLANKFFVFENGGGVRMVLSGGNLGVGTNAPASKLDVAHSGADSSALRLGDKTTIANNTGIYMRTSGIASISAAGGDIVLDTNMGSAERVRVLGANGNVGIGITNPSYKLDVVGDVNASGSVRSNGVALTSDRRFKKDVVVVANALARLLSIRGVTYHWKPDEFPERGFDDARQIGVIAQEVERVFPELVSEGVDGYKAVNYPALVAPVIEATRELARSVAGVRAANERQDVELKRLKDENAQLKRELDLIKRKLGL